jgi:hypothetical protein
LTMERGAKSHPSPSIRPIELSTPTDPCAPSHATATAGLFRYPQVQIAQLLRVRR